MSRRFRVLRGEWFLIVELLIWSAFLTGDAAGWAPPLFGRTIESKWLVLAAFISFGITALWRIVQARTGGPDLEFELPMNAVKPPPDQTVYWLTLKNGEDAGQAEDVEVRLMSIDPKPDTFESSILHDRDWSIRVINAGGFMSLQTLTIARSQQGDGTMRTSAISDAEYLNRLPLEPGAQYALRYRVTAKHARPKDCIATVKMDDAGEVTVTWR